METPDTRIVLRVLEAVCDPKNPMVDHPRQPADYVHTDGTVWTWKERWRPLAGGQHMRVYDLVPDGRAPEMPPRGGNCGH
jgi:hypothetical protein